MDAIRSYPKTPTLGELLIDCEGDRALRAVLIGMLRERLYPPDSRTLTHRQPEA